MHIWKCYFNSWKIAFCALSHLAVHCSNIPRNTNVFMSKGKVAYRTRTVHGDKPVCVALSQGSHSNDWLFNELTSHPALHFDVIIIEIIFYNVQANSKLVMHPGEIKQWFEINWTYAWGNRDTGIFNTSFSKHRASNAVYYSYVI